MISNSNEKEARHGSIKLRSGPSGIHLFNRASGLNVLIDEITPPETIWAPAPRQVSIALTNACDLACSYCYAPKMHANLAYNSLVSWLDELDCNGTIGIGFGGGEPTLYPRFADICAHATQNTGLAVTFTTHGHHLDNALLARIKGNVNFVRVSMDGVGTTYERLRGRQFHLLSERLVALKEIAPFGINYVVNSDTIPDIEKAAIFAEQMGASEFLLLPESKVNGIGGIDAPTLNLLRAWINRYTGRPRLSVSESSAEGMPVCNPFEKEGGLRGYAHINAKGLLMRTSYDENGILIGTDGILSALNQLKKQRE